MSTISESPIKIGGQMYVPTAPPRGTAYREDLGLIAADGMDGVILHRWAEPNDHAYEVRSVVTPGGEYLVAVCAGSHHYGNSTTKVNDLIAYRSTDKGKTWTGGEPLWPVAYNQHGFGPLIPHGSKRIYALGTEPHFDHFNGVENAAIGFRFSDDDGYTWSEPKLISPLNDPGYQGMSVIKPCETDRGTWLLSSHTGTKYEDNKGSSF